MAARVLVVDSHPVTRWGVCAVLSQHECFSSMAVLHKIGSTHEIYSERLVFGASSHEPEGESRRH